MRIQAAIDLESIGTVVRDSVEGVIDEIVEVVRDETTEQQRVARALVQQSLSDTVYNYTPKKYRFTWNLAKAVRSEIEEIPDGVILTLYNDTSTVRVKRPKQYPIEEIPWTIETGEEYPTEWKGPTEARPYMEEGAKAAAANVADYLSKMLPD